MNSLANVLRIGAGIFSTSVFAFLMLIAACTAETWEPPIPHGAGITSWFDNGTNGQYVLNVVGNVSPDIDARGLHARVLSDTNCAPDARGLNHCHNVLRFENGEQVEVINNHQMSVHRCLRPGETVVVNALNDKWIRLQTRG